MSASLSVGEGMMMIGQVESAMRSDGMKLVILQIRKHLKRCFISTMKLIVGIFHLIMSETCFKATFIERLVMSNERQSPHIFRSFMPDDREYWSLFRVFLFDSMNFGVPITIIIWHRFYKAIETIYNLPVFHYDDTDAACAPNIAVRRLEVDSGKVREIGNNDLIVRRF